MRLKLALGFIAAFSLSQTAVSAESTPQQSVFKVCGAEWQKLKADGKQGDQTWLAFLKECRKRVESGPNQTAATAKPEAPTQQDQPKFEAVPPKTEAAPQNPEPAPQKPIQAPVKAPAQAPAQAPAKPAESDGMAKMHARQKACGQEWQSLKEAGKVPEGQKWPQFWSECNTRLKEVGQ